MKHPFTFRGYWDENIFNSVVADNEYRLPEKFEEGSVVIDIGCHIGSFSYACLMRGVGKVYSFEADKENYELAKKHLSEFGDRVVVEHKAVWRSDIDSVTLRHSGYGNNTGEGNVLYEENRGQEVETVSLDKIIETIGKDISILKLDCEGSEYPILYTSNSLSKVRNILGEYHDLKPIKIANTHLNEFEYNVEGLSKYLVQKGFSLEINPGGLAYHFIAKGK